MIPTTQWARTGHHMGTNPGAETQTLATKGPTRSVPNLCCIRSPLFGDVARSALRRLCSGLTWAYVTFSGTAPEHRGASSGHELGTIRAQGVYGCRRLPAAASSLLTAGEVRHA